MNDSFVQIPLVEAAIEVRFPGNTYIDVLRSELQRHVSNTYPLLFVPNVNAGDVPALLPYRFANENRTRHIGTSLNSFSLVAQDYLGWQTFSGEFTKLWQFFVEKADIKHLTRVGVRFKNKFDEQLKGQQLAETLPSYLAPVNNDAVSFEGFYEFERNSNQMTVKIEFSRDEQKLVVDYDMFVHNVDLSALANTLNDLHTALEREFRKAVKESLVAKLGVSKNGEGDSE